MKGRKRAQGKLPETGVSPQEAVRQLAGCQLSGRLEGSCVIVDADASTSQLLHAACLGRPYDIFQQAVQAVESSAEQIGRAASPSKAASKLSASSEGAATSRSNQVDLKKSSENLPEACKGKGGLAAEAISYAARWGATCEIGKLGAMPISLPAVQAADVQCHSGIALSRTAADNLRHPVLDSGSAEERQQQKGASRQQKQEIRRSKHAKRGQDERQACDRSSTRVWMLSLEEAFFMHYTLQCLTVAGDSGPCSSQDCSEHALEQHLEKCLESDGECLQGLWEQCMRLKADFAHSYLPFHHFISKGWVVRPGAEYGIDYVLYDRHPSVAHSSYCVLALTGSKRPEVLRWTDIEAASRVCADVLKKLLLLYVFEDPHTSVETPDYLSAVSVEERLVQRWVPGQK